MPMILRSWILWGLVVAVGCGDTSPEPEPEPPAPAPETTITQQPPALTNLDRVELAFGITGDPQGRQVLYDCATDDSTSFTACTSPLVRTGLADGEYSLRVRARWLTGGIDLTPAEAKWKVDRTPPQTTITEGPQGDVPPLAAMVRFTANEAEASFECRTGSAAFAPCTSPFAITPALGDGSFEVRAIDLAGNADETPALRSYRGIVPETTITAQPGAVTNQDSAQIAFTSPTTALAPISFECALDGSTTFAPCTSPLMRSGLGSGTYSVAVRALWQGTAHVDESPAMASWTVDRTPPDTTITGGPQGDSAMVDAAAYTFTSEAGATFKCSLDGEPFAACTSPKTISVQAGEHSFAVRASDAAGNQDATPAVATYRGVGVDTRVDSAPPAVTASSSATISFSSPTTPLATIAFECALDGSSTFTPCTSPLARTGLGSGSYSVAVRARWVGGAADDSPAMASWSVDQMPPETTITGGPQGDTGVGSSSFTFTSEAGATFECRLDGAAFAACTSPHSVSVTLGSHTFEVRATDGVGNVDPTPAARSYTGQNVRAAPETEISSSPASPTNATTASIVFSSPTPPGADTLAFECALDGSTAFSPCTSPLTRTGLTEGNYSVRVRARWVGGEIDATPAEATWSVDLTAPDTTITAGPSGDTPLGDASFTFSSNDVNAALQCRIDSAAFAPCVSPLLVNVTAGAHTFEVRAIDAAGNLDATPATRLYRGVTGGGGTRLRLVAANLTSGNLQSYDPGHGGRILDALNPDIVMIQEFNYFPNNGDTEIRNWVTSVFGPEYDYYRESGAQIPNGVISRYPIVSAGTWQDAESPNREFVWARIDVPGDKDLWAISVHLLTRDATTRNTEAVQLRDYINANVPASDYLVIGGDFNTRSRTEAALTTFSTIVHTAAPYPVDQAGNGNTNAGRSSPYDWVLIDSDLKALQVPVTIGSNSFANGLVVDTRVYTPIADLAPALASDSGASNMQHMAVVIDVRLP